MSQHLSQTVAWETSILGFLQRQFLATQPKSLPTTGTHLASKTALITGSNVGLGLESARQLLRLGLSTLILAVRSQARGDAAATSLRTEFPAAEIKVWILDMGSYDSITAFAKRCEGELARLDIAILNAGFMTAAFQTDGATGHESVLQINYLSTALLAGLLVPVLRSKREALKREGEPEPAPGRLTVVSSDTQYWSPLNREYPKLLAKGDIFPQFDTPEGFDVNVGYWRSKLLITMFIARLAQAVDSNEVIVNTVNPGLTKGTSFFREGTPGGRIGGILFSAFMAAISRSPEAGANSYVDAAVWKGKESHGSFVSDWDIKPYPSIAYSEDGKAFLAKVWQETMEELKFAKVSEIIERLMRN